MRTKLFLTFFAVILIALVSNLIYERLIIRDFEEYVLGVEEDRLYWVLPTVEGSYTGEGWDTHLLSHPMQWGTMLGYDLVVLDAQGRHVASSLEAMKDITPTMKRRIESIVHVDRPIGDYEEFPLYSEGQEIGFLLVRPLESRRELGMKETMFKQRGRNFLLISFLIAGGSAVALSVLMSLFLTRPLRRLRDAAVRVADGDLGVRVAPGARDEVGNLIDSFNQMVNSLEREESLRRHLTSNIAHELRTPLAVLRANFEAAADGIVECNEEAVSGLQSEVDRLTNLVSGIEDFTKAEAYLLKPAVYETVSLSEFTRSIAVSMEKVFKDKGLKLTVIGQESLMADIDASKLEIVLRNLLSNALAHASGSTASISWGATGGGFFLEVSDSGGGIAPEEMDNIFKRFHKGKDSGGVGLGLAIAKELVEAMGGTISAANVPGGGAAFRVELPTK